MINKIDPNGNVIWTYTLGASATSDVSECSEVRTNLEAGGEYVYGLGQDLPNFDNIHLVKLDADTGQPEPDYVPEYQGFGEMAGNAQNMAIGSNGVYLCFMNHLAGSIVVQKFGFDGSLLAEAITGIPYSMALGITTGFWQGQEYVWVGFPNEIRRYDTDLVEADISEAGLGCHMVDPSPFTDYPDEMEVVNDGTRTLLYVAGQMNGIHGFDGYVFRFQLTDDRAIAENGPGELFDTSDHIFDWGGNDALLGLIVDDNFDVFVSGRARAPSRGPIFKFSDY